MEADELWRIDSCPAAAHVVLKEKTEGTNKAWECTEVIKIFTDSPVLFQARARVAHLPPTNPPPATSPSCLEGGESVWLPLVDDAWAEVKCVTCMKRLGNDTPVITPSSTCHGMLWMELLSTWVPEKLRGESPASLQRTWSVTEGKSVTSQ